MSRNFTQVNHAFYIETEIIFPNSDIQTIVIANTENYLNALRIKEAYQENIFPLVSAEYYLTSETRDLIRDNDVEIHVSGYIYDANTTATLDQNSDDDIIYDDKIFDFVIRYYEKDYTFTAIKKDNDQNNGGSAITAMPNVKYDISGIPKNLIIKNQNIHNICLQKVGVVEAVVYLLSRVSDDVPLVIEPFNNSENYESLIIPPTNVSKGLDFIHTQYGLYDSGMNLYFGIEGTYLTSLDPNTMPFKNHLYLEILNIDDSDQREYTERVSIATDGSNDMRVYSTRQPSINNIDKIQNDRVGKDRVFYSYDDYFSLQARTDINSDGAYDKVRYFFNENGSKLFEEEFIHIGRVNRGFTFPIVGVNPYLITPLTKVTVTGGYTDLNGDYLISQKAFSFTSPDSEHFQPVLMITLVSVE